MQANPPQVFPAQAFPHEEFRRKCIRCSPVCHLPHEHASGSDSRWLPIRSAPPGRWQSHILGDGSQPGDGEIPLRRKAEDDGKQTDGFQGQPGIPEVLGTHHREIPVFWCSYYWHCSSPFTGGGCRVSLHPPPLFQQKSAPKR